MTPFSHGGGTGTIRELVPEVLAGERLDRALSLMASLTRAESARCVSEGRVRVNGEVVTSRSRRLVAGEVVEADVEARREGEIAEPDRSVDVPIIHIDDAIVVVDKPAGMVVHPGAGHRTGTLVQGLLARYPEMASVGEAGRPGIVHRLDKGTSGLLVAARTPDAYASLVRQLGARLVERVYTALVWGAFDSPQGMVDAPVGRSARDPTRMAVSARGREARTTYQVVRTFDEPAALSLVECRLETGRTHQIRVHLGAIGHPVVGDRRYRGARAPLEAGRPLLHAARLAFDHPASGERVVFESALPPDFEAVLAALA